MAKKRKDTKTMERAATSYAKYFKVDVEEELIPDYDKIVVQPFTPTVDPTVLGLKPIPNAFEYIDSLTKELARDLPDIMDVEAEEADLQEGRFFPKKKIHRRRTHSGSQTRTGRLTAKSRQTIPENLWMT